MTQNIDSISLFGENLRLRPVDRSRLKGIFVGAITAFDFYDAEFKGNKFVVLKGKSPKRMPPSHLMYFAQRIGEKLNSHVVFLLEGLKTIERDRLVQKGIYFIVSGKYAFLPFLISNRLSSNADKASELTPLAQYILLYHLQISSIDNLTSKDLAAIMPYPYISITRAVKVLSDCNILSVESDGKHKRIKFNDRGEALWSKCLPMLKSPIKKAYYIDGVLNGDYKICGINALSQYTRLNPDQQLMYAMTKAEFVDIKGLPMFDLEGDIRIEVWSYPPIPVNERVVDPLSLYLTLRNDPDPRVEKELEYLLKEIWSKD